MEQQNFYNIRIFAVFDENELDTRFIKGNIQRYINKEQIIIHQDKFMDFFYMKDLISLVEFYILNKDVDKQIDCSYITMYKLSDIANMINKLSDYKVDTVIERKEMSKPYIGTFSGIVLNEFIGLQQGIKNVYFKLNESNI